MREGEDDDRGINRKEEEIYTAYAAIGVHIRQWTSASAG